MKAVIDEDACLGCGICEGIVPEVFQLSSECHAIVRLNPVPQIYWNSVKDAYEQCPEEAISIEA